MTKTKNFFGCDSSGDTMTIRHNRHRPSPGMEVGQGQLGWYCSRCALQAQSHGHLVRYILWRQAYSEEGEGGRILAQSLLLRRRNLHTKVPSVGHKKPNAHRKLKYPLGFLSVNVFLSCNRVQPTGFLNVPKTNI